MGSVLVRFVFFCLCFSRASVQYGLGTCALYCFLNFQNDLVLCLENAISQGVYAFIVFPTDKKTA